MVTLVKTWLKGDEEVVVEGYKWFGNNRKHLHRKAVRGSGGVGVLIREEVLKRYQEILETEVDRGHAVDEAEPGGGGRGTGSVLCTSRVIKSWKEL